MNTITVNYRNRKKSFVYDINEPIDLYVKFKNSQDLCKGYVEYNHGKEDFQFAWIDYYPPSDWSNEDGTEIKYSGHIAEVLLRFFETKE